MKTLIQILSFLLLPLFTALNARAEVGTIETHTGSYESYFLEQARLNPSVKNPVVTVEKSVRKQKSIRTKIARKGRQFTWKFENGLYAITSFKVANVSRALPLPKAITPTTAPVVSPKATPPVPHEVDPEPIEPSVTVLADAMVTINKPIVIKVKAVDHQPVPIVKSRKSAEPIPNFSNYTFRPPTYGERIYKELVHLVSKIRIDVIVFSLICTTFVFSVFLVHHRKKNRNLQTYR